MIIDLAYLHIIYLGKLESNKRLGLVCLVLLKVRFRYSV